MIVLSVPIPPAVDTDSTGSSCGKVNFAPEVRRCDSQPLPGSSSPCFLACLNGTGLCCGVIRLARAATPRVVTGSLHTV